MNQRVSSNRTRTLRSKSIIMGGLLLLSAICHSYCWAANSQESFLDSPIDEFNLPSENEFVDLCTKLRKPCGIEVSDSKDLKAARKESPKKLIKTTPREILELHVRRLPRQHWLLTGGVINLAPKMRVGEDVLARTLDAISIHGTSSEKAAMTVMHQAGIQCAYEPSGRSRYGVVDIELKNTTVRDALNAIAKADGQVIWYFNRNETSGNNRAKLLMLTWRESGLGSTDRRKVKVLPPK